MYKIVLVEDDLTLAKQLKEALERFKYDIIIIEDFTCVAKTILELKPHLVLMDVNLPYHDGFYWTQLIRTTSNLPILFLSSRDEKLEQVMAMSIGADDYLTKPIDLEITLIKIQALLRRTYDYEFNYEYNILEYQGLQLDLNKVELMYQEQVISLSKNEFKLIQKLLLNKEEYVSRSDLMNYLWDSNSFIDDNAFNVNMSRLRKKLEKLCNKDVIKTKRKIGYSIEI